MADPSDNPPQDDLPPPEEQKPPDTKKVKGLREQLRDFTEKTARAAQDISVSAVQHLPEPIKKPIRQMVGRVATNVVRPVNYLGTARVPGEAGITPVPKWQETAQLFTPKNLPNTIQHIVKDEPAYDYRKTMDDPDMLSARRPLFREFFDLPPQDTGNVYLKQGKDYRINPATTNPDALKTLNQFKAKGSDNTMSYNDLSGYYQSGQPDPWDFNLHPEEIKDYQGKSLSMDDYARQMMQALGRPAMLQTGGYAQGGVVAAPSGSSVGLNMLAPAPAAPDPYTSNVMSYADKVRSLLDNQSAPAAAPVTGPLPGAPPANPGSDNMTINARSGEFVFPEPVTKYYGVKKLETMVQKALEDINPPGQPAQPPMPQAQSFARGGLIGRKHFLRHVAAPHPPRRAKMVSLGGPPLDASSLPPMPSGPEPAGPPDGSPPMTGLPMGGPPPAMGPPMGTPMGPMIRRQPQGYAYGGVVKPYGGGVSYGLGGGYGGWGGGAPYGGGTPYGGGNPITMPNPQFSVPAPPIAWSGGPQPLIRPNWQPGPQPYIKPQWWGGPQPFKRYTPL